jgi:hypothetical protein
MLIEDKFAVVPKLGQVVIKIALIILSDKWSIFYLSGKRNTRIKRRITLF